MIKHIFRYEVNELSHHVGTFAELTNFIFYLSQTWTCFHCKMENVAQNTECWFCKAGHMQRSVLKPATSQNEKWTCIKCQTLHYAERATCYKCRTPRKMTSSQPRADPNSQAL